MGDQSSVDVSISGISGVNGDGSATASGRATARRVETEQSSLRDPDSLPWPDFNWPIATVSLNRAELGSRISDRVRDGASREQAWASELDRALRRGVSHAARTKLANDATDNMFSTAGSLVEPSFMIGAILGGNAVGVGSQMGAYALCVGIQLGLNKIRTGDFQFRRKRWSFMPYAAQPDRFALAALAARVPGLVKHRPAGESETA